MTGAAARDLPARIQARASNAGARVDDRLAAALAAYVDLLARWNRTINLTALEVDPPDDEAIDRLVIEPIVAAAHINLDEQMVIDVGSGGGSPALPLKLALPRLHVVLVESKTRKASFLREAVRHLELENVVVENCRLEDLAGDSVGADLITMRAVRLDESTAHVVCALLEPKGRIFFFGSATQEPPAIGAEWRMEKIPLVLERSSWLTIVRADLSSM